jgi:hypothetical protein
VIALWEFAASELLLPKSADQLPFPPFQYSLAHGDTLLLDLSHTLVVAAGAWRSRS